MTTRATRRPPAWRQLQADTAPWAERLQFKFFREASPAKKLRAMARLNRMARTLALSGIRDRYPQATPAELRRRLADKLLGPELAAKLYGPITDDGQMALEGASPPEEPAEPGDQARLL